MSVDTGADQFVLDDHDEDAKHPDEESVVADTLALLKQRFPSAEPVADVSLVLTAERERRQARTTSTTVASRERGWCRSRSGCTDGRRRAACVGARQQGCRLDTHRRRRRQRLSLMLRSVLSVARVLGLDTDQRYHRILIAPAVIPATVPAADFHGRWYRQGGHPLSQLPTTIRKAKNKN